MPSNTFTGIIDIYHGNDFSVASTVAAGVTAVIHKASEGTSKKNTDPKYATRKAAAVSAGLLWGAFHLTNGGKPKKQLDNFLGMEDGSDPSILLALDWEKSNDGTIVDIDGIREFVQLFHDELGRYPVLYGGWTLRDSPEIVMGDELLGKCPLWYQRYQWEPRALPVRTWPTYTLWQFADQNRGFGAPPTNVLPGADFNRYQGSAADLATAWPLSAPGPKFNGKPGLILPRTYKVTASSLNVRKGPSIDEKVLGSLDRDDEVAGTDLSVDKNWVKVSKGKLTGWSAMRWLRPLVGGGIPDEPTWMPVARGEIGVKEVPGPGDDPRIVEYLQSTSLGSPENQNDETFWCSAFVNWCIEEVSMEGTNSAWARDWLNWGKKISTPVVGCITVFSRDSGGHVGFFIERKDGLIYVLGGNQHDCVCIEGHDEGRLLGYRMNA
jgi:uncharacterized protein (TIGR02594 family)